MAEIIVLNRENAKKFSFEEKNKTFAIISINDSSLEPNTFCNNNLCLKSVNYFFFDDIDKPEENLVVISDDIAAEIAHYAKEWFDKVDTIVVHCSAGISRSAGCAAAILKYFTGSDTQIFNDYSKHPNMLVYKKVLEALFTIQEEEI